MCFYITYRRRWIWLSVNVHALQWIGLHSYKWMNWRRSAPTRAGLLSHVWKAGNMTLRRPHLPLFQMWVHRNVALVQNIKYMQHITAVYSPCNIIFSYVVEQCYFNFRGCITSGEKKKKGQLLTSIIVHSPGQPLFPLRLKMVNPFKTDFHLKLTSYIKFHIVPQG